MNCIECGSAHVIYERERRPGPGRRAVKSRALADFSAVVALKLSVLYLVILASLIIVVPPFAATFRPVYLTRLDYYFIAGLAMLVILGIALLVKWALTPPSARVLEIWGRFR